MFRLALFSLFILHLVVVGFAHAKEKYQYLLSKPLESSIQLGRGSQVFHYAMASAYQLLKMGFYTYATGEPLVGAAILLSDAPWFPAFVASQTAIDMKARSMLRRIKVLKELSKIPGIQTIKTLSSSNLKFKNLLLSKQDNIELFILETSQPINLENIKARNIGWKEEWGVPVLIEDPAGTKIRLRFSAGENTSQTNWTPTLEELLDHKPIPKEIGDKWRSDFNQWQKKITAVRSPFQKVSAHFTKPEIKSLKTTADILFPSGEEYYLGALTNGLASKKLLGISMVDRALGWSKKTFQRILSNEKALPVSVTQVVSSKSGCKDFLLHITGRRVLRQIVSK